MASKLAQMQARFQQRQLQEKEEKLLKLYENQQQRAFDRVGRSSAGSNDSLSYSSTGQQGGKVRQMFDERRQKAGIDKSHPLEPLKSKTNVRGSNVERKIGITKTTVRSTVQNSCTVIQNCKPLVKKREVTSRVYENNNNDKETYEESRRLDEEIDATQSKSYREIIDMLDNNNSTDSLDNEQMPNIILDENNCTSTEDKLKTHKKNVDNSKRIIVKKLQTRNTAANDITTKNVNEPKKNNLTVTKKSPTARNPNISKSSVPNSPAKKINSAGLMNPEKSKTNSARAPSSTRPSAKQQSPRSVVNRDDLAECNYCGRRFAEDRIQKHEDVCSKTGKKKRRAYDATKHRVMGTELESYVLSKGPKSKSNVVKSSSRTLPKKDWRRTHEEFISAIRAAKVAQAHLAKGGKLSDLPPPPPSSNPDYVQCPHCQRRFNESAAERHIPKCADYQFNKQKPGPASKTKTNYGKK